MKRNLVFVWATFLLLTILVSVMFTKSSVQAGYQQQEDAVIQRASEIAREFGLQKSQPDAVAIKQTALAEWFSIINFEPGPDAEKLGLDPNKKIWIVVIRGPIDWNGPGRQGGPGDVFDNISIALSVDNLEYLGSYSVGSDTPLPLNLPR